MRLRIDHVTLAGQRLEAMANALARAGLTADYGGLHSNGITHMSLLGFDDGSYLELVSVHLPNQVSPWWHQHIVHAGGPCAWAVAAPAGEAMEAEASRLREAGVPVDGPHVMRRARADRVPVEWDIAFVGDHEPGALHPFMVGDRTPRANRVRPSASVRGTELSGVDAVVVAVPDVVPAANAFRRVHGLGQAEPWACVEFPGPMLRFTDAPLYLAAPGSGDDWLGRRLNRYGPSPCAFLLRSSHFDRSLERLHLGVVNPWGRRGRFAWLAGETMRPLNLAVVGD